MSNRLLLVEDDETLGQMLEDFFEDNGLIVSRATYGEMGIRLFDDFRPNIVLMDVMLPDMLGFNVAEEIQKKDTSIPFIFMTGTAFDEEYYNRAYINIKAKNYLMKPINPHAALAQIKGILSPSTSFNYSFGDIKIKIESQSLIVGDKNIVLRNKDIYVLSVLLSNSNKVVSRKHLKEEVWRDDRSDLENTLNSCITRIRRDISVFDFIKIKTIYGEGYKLKVEVD